MFREILNIYIGGHGGQGDHGVQHIIDTAYDESDMCREDVMGETVKKADNHQDQCVGDHHDSIAEMVNDLAYSR